MRVLYIVDALPPEKSGRVNKVMRRIKYLVRQGWQVTVLAPAVGKADQDPNWESDFGHLVTIYRTPYAFMRRWPSLRHNKGRPVNVETARFREILDVAFVPKGFIRWFPYALAQGVALAKQADVILTMNNPVMLHLIGLVLKLVTTTPWVAEFRDPLVGYAYSRRGPEMLNCWLESLIVRQADRIIQWLDFVPDIIQDRYLHLPQDRFVAIPYTGYDSDVFTGIPHAAERTADTPCIISYTGSFYGDSITAVPFLRALARFLAEVPSARSTVKVQFAGDWSGLYDELIQGLKLNDIVTYLGYISQEACVACWLESAFVLLILGSEQDNDLRIPSKFWDYVGVRRSQLALVPLGSRVARIIEEEGLGIVADGQNEDDIIRALHIMWARFLQGNLAITPSEQFLQEATCENAEHTVSRVLIEACNIKKKSH